jgi:hypothetical protein
MPPLIEPSSLPEMKVSRVDRNGTGENRNHDSHQQKKKNLKFSGSPAERSFEICSRRKKE